MLSLFQGPLSPVVGSDLQRMIDNETEITTFTFDVVDSSITESSEKPEGQRARKMRIEKFEEARKKYGGIKLFPERVCHFSFSLSLSLF